MGTGIGETSFIRRLSLVDNCVLDMNIYIYYTLGLCMTITNAFPKAIYYTCT